MFLFLDNIQTPSDSGFYLICTASHLFFVYLQPFLDVLLSSVFGSLIIVILFGLLTKVIHFVMIYKSHPFFGD